MKHIIQAIKTAYSTQDPHDYGKKNGVSDDIAAVHDIAYYRDRIFYLLTVCLIPTGFIALVPGVLMAIKSGTTLGYFVAVGDTLIAVALIYVILSERIQVKMKKAIVIGTLYLLAVFLLITLGSFGPGVIYISLLTLLMSLTFTSKVAKLSIWFNLTICIFVGVIIQFKIIDSLLLKQYNLGDWIAYSSNLMVFSIISYLLINNLIKSLEIKINKLSISEARLHGLLASQTNYVIRTDINGKYTYANEKFIRDFGWLYNDDNIIGHDVMTSILHHHHQRLNDTINKCLERPSEVFQVSLDKPKAKGGVLTTLWEVICMKDETATTSEIQCVGIDISERIRVEQELELSLEDLYKHNKELQTYAYVISHNLRAPIANIIGLVSLIEIDRRDEQAMNDYIRDLKESATSLDLVVRDLSKGVSIRGNSTDLSTEMINLQDIFTSVRGDLANLIASTNTELDLPSEPFFLSSHKPYLYVIFHNLIGNAIKYKSERQPQVKVTITTNAQYVIVAIADNGSGIDIEKQYDDLFKPYKRFNNIIPGKGLGLFFVKRHVDALGGIILVDSGLGVGTTFKVVLPKHDLLQRPSLN